MMVYEIDLSLLDNKVKQDLRNNYVVWLGRTVRYARSVAENWLETDRIALVAVLDFGKKHNYFLLKSLANITDMHDKRQFIKKLKRLEKFSALIFKASTEFIYKLLGR